MRMQIKKQVVGWTLSDDIDNAALIVEDRWGFVGTATATGMIYEGDSVADVALSICEGEDWPEHCWPEEAVAEQMRQVLGRSVDLELAF